MAIAARGMRAFRVYLEMIKFEHSVFALPFAMIGMLWASGWPGWRVFGWIVLAMVSCRSAAMAFNRLADRDVDAKNPRTMGRAIPAGVLRVGQVAFFFCASVALFFLAAFELGPLAAELSPIALGVTLFYSLTKRFTPYSHFFLGLSLGIAPAAAWVACTGRLDLVILPMTAAVTLWTAGFDIIYALQDDAFDKDHGLRSLPQTYGRPAALSVSRGCHVLAVLCLAESGILTHAGVAYYAGVVFAAALLAYEQSLVKIDDLRRVDIAFFTLNGFVSIGVFLFALVDKALPRMLR